MDLLTKAKSIGSGGCESDGIEEEENFSQDSGEGADNDTDSKRAKGFGRRQRRKCFSVFVKRLAQRKVVKLPSEFQRNLQIWCYL